MGTYVELNNFEVPKRMILLKATIQYGAPNYSLIINELIENHEMTSEKIAHLLPVSGSSSVQEWAKGGRPNYEAGEALMDLWKIFTQKLDKDVPRISQWSL